MNAKEKLTQLNEAQASKILKMAELGYKFSKPTLQTSKNISAYKSLMTMIGCADAKEKMQEVLASVRMNKIIRARGRQTNATHYHMAFLGAPGSCKTTTARLFAEILYSEGVIKTKRLVEFSKATLVGRYQGETPRLVKKAFQENRGSCILIDEAYSLDDTDSRTSNTYGAEAIDEIILQLEEATDTVVIFAGYTEKMQNFLDANPGLRSRVPILVTFPDYTTPELLAICKKLAQDRGYSISESAEERIFNILDSAKTQVNFGNGRYCRNLVEKAISEKSLRLGVMNEDFDYSKFTDLKVISDEELFTLDAECFKETVQSEQKRKIGF